MIELAITGAAGRMGMRLVALARQEGGFEITAALERPQHPQQGRDAGEVAGIGMIGTKITHELPASAAMQRVAEASPTRSVAADVLVDFTSAASMRHWLRICRQRGIAMIIGTTGLSEADHGAIDEAAADIAVLQAPNMSLGVNVLFRIAGEVARMLGEEYDIEIAEAHHRFKKDAPSGTATGLADAILAATGKTRDALVHGRQGEDAARKPGEIGMHALRLGDEVGKHTAYFAALGERLELTHLATNRDTFAHGALRAAKWLAERKPGRYGMADVLGL